MDEFLPPIPVEGAEAVSDTDQYTFIPSITLPIGDDLNIRLARIDYLDQLDQARGDYLYWTSSTWFIIGLAAGILTNWITSTEAITAISVTVLVILVPLGIWFGRVAAKYKAREELYKKKVQSSGITLQEIAGRRV